MNTIYLREESEHVSHLCDKELSYHVTMPSM